MKLFSALVRAALRNRNDKLTQRDTKEAQLAAYQATGKKITNATKRNKPINGKQTYQEELAKRMALVNQRSKRREQFFDDLTK